MDLTFKAFHNNETDKGKANKIANSSCNFTIENKPPFSEK